MGANTKEIEAGTSALSKVPGSIQEAAAVKKDSDRRSTREVLEAKAKSEADAASAKSSSGTPTQELRSKLTEVPMSKNGGKNIDYSKIKGGLTYRAGDIESAPSLSMDKKREWNKYLFWLKGKGLAGKPDLDQGGKGEALFSQYLKENPNAKISKADMPSVRKEYINMRDRLVREQVTGKSEREAGTTVSGYTNSSGKQQQGETGDYTEFMEYIDKNEKTGNPNYAGQHLTRTPFPDVVDEGVYFNEGEDEGGDYLNALTPSGAMKQHRSKKVDAGTKTVTTNRPSNQNTTKSSGTSLTLSNY